MKKEFIRVRGPRARKRCKNKNYNSYCECGCQTQHKEDLNYRIEGVELDYRPGDILRDIPDPTPYKLTRNDKVVGSVCPADASVILDRHEYIGVTKQSRLYRFIREAQKIEDVTQDFSYYDCYDVGEDYINLYDEWFSDFWWEDVM